MRGLPNKAVVRQFLTSFAAGMTAIGIVNLLRWLRAPVVGDSSTTASTASREAAAR